MPAHNSGRILLTASSWGRTRSNCSLTTLGRHCCVRPVATIEVIPPICSHGACERIMIGEVGEYGLGQDKFGAESDGDPDSTQFDRLPPDRQTAKGSNRTRFHGDNHFRAARGFRRRSTVRWVSPAGWTNTLSAKTELIAGSHPLCRENHRSSPCTLRNDLLGSTRFQADSCRGIPKLLFPLCHTLSLRL